jgi:DNA-binding CsgD family transcriptional regulator/tetratricopeptide (TPR) repeat protein
VLDSIAVLVDHSLVVQETTPAGESRYRMLGTIREFAEERLTQSGEAEAARAALAAFVLAEAERLEPRFFGPEDRAVLDQLEAEIDNYRVALAWAIERDPPVALRLAGALWCLWRVRGFPTEGRTWLERALAATAGERTPARSKALDWAGDLAWLQGEFPRATAAHAESLVLAREIGDRAGEARALFGLADVARRSGDPARSVDHYEAALDHFRALGQDVWVAGSLASLGLLAHDRDDDAAATALLDEAVALYRSTGFRWGLAWAVRLLAVVVRIRGDLPRAADLYVEGLELGGANADRRGLAAGLAGLAEIASALGDDARAARLLGAAAVLAEAVDVSLRLIVGSDLDETWDRVERRLGQTAAAEERAAGRALPLAAAIAEAAAVGSAARQGAIDGRTVPVPGLPSGDEERPTPYGLTAREMDVLRLLATGRSTQDIAETLSVSPRTVTTHIGNILTKLGVSSRAAAVAIALQQKIV